MALFFSVTPFICIVYEDPGHLRPAFAIAIRNDGTRTEQNAGDGIGDRMIIHNPMESPKHPRYPGYMDTLDLRIVAALQENGRISNADLARLVDLAPSTTLERVRRLEERGIIKGYQARLDPQAIGLPVQAFVLINLRRHQALSIDDFEDHIRAVPEVLACHHLTGRYDYMLHVAVRDIEHLRQLVARSIAAIDGVEKQETFLVLSTVKEDSGFPTTPLQGNAGPAIEEA